MSRGQVLHYQGILRIFLLDKKKCKRFKFELQNVPSLFELGNMHNLFKEMKRMKIDILSIDQYQ